MKKSKMSGLAPIRELQIDGESYQIVVDIEAIRVAERIADVPILSGMDRRTADHPKLDLICAFFYAALQRHHKEVSLQQASSMVTMQNWRTIWNALVILYVDAMGEPEEEAEGNPQASQS
ncbi:hypothetical protein ACOBR2_06690 [Telmatobacter bradus]|uniref:hypothetical protein n=1 Tax=Telmatobacter bradus TaxID=474953 RepID=UPI003B4292D1